MAWRGGDIYERSKREKCLPEKEEPKTMIVFGGGTGVRKVGGHSFDEKRRGRKRSDSNRGALSGMRAEQ